MTNKDVGAFEQTVLGMIVTGFKREDMRVSSADADVLRGLAGEIAKIAAGPRQAEVKARWRRHNGLQAGRPMVFCDPENGWNEIVTLDRLQCKGVLARRWEVNLRKEVFWGKCMGDDKPVEAVFSVPYTVAADNWGLRTDFEKRDQRGSYTWKAPLADYAEDLARVELQPVDIDWDTTRTCLETAHSVFDGILEVRRKGTWWWSLGLTMPVAFLRGLENMMLDFFDHPDELKALLKRVSDGLMRRLDCLESQNLLSLNNDGTYVGSGGFGYTDELPQKDSSGSVRCRDLWGFAESQETGTVSPEMYEEFIFPFEQPLLDRFGLNCYGCCEPLDRRWRVVKRHKNLRRVSCSAWADYEKMAEFLQDDYIFSMKVNPADIARAEGFDRGAVKASLARNLQITKGCVVEVIMKDNHTIGNRPENVIEWRRLANEAIDEVYA